MPLEITPLNAPLGACVRGTRLKGDINPNHFQIIQQALLDHHLLLFPDQDITEAEQVGFSGLFGKLEIHPSKEHRSSVQQEIYRVSNVNEDGQIFSVDSYKAKYLTGTRIWHTDSSFRAIPSLGSLLRAAEVPPEGGETYFCNLHTRPMKPFPSTSRSWSILTMRCTAMTTYRPWCSVRKHIR